MFVRKFQKSSLSNKGFNPADLNSTNSDREYTMKTMYCFFKKMIDVSEASLIKNVDYLFKKSTKLNHEDLKWIGPTQKDLTTADVNCIIQINFQRAIITRPWELLLKIF